MKGFTLVELIVVIAIISILASVSLASFASYGNKQILQTSASDVSNMLVVARSRSLSQVKPSQCLNQRLFGYQVNFDTANGSYGLSAVCDSTYLLDTKKLSKDISFLAGSTSSVLFSVVSGAPLSSASIGMTGYGQTAAITIDPAGSISTGNMFTPDNSVVPTPTSVQCQWWEIWCSTPVPTSAPTPTPMPTLAPTSTLIPTPTSTLPTSTPAPTPTPKPTATPTPKPSPTPTPTPADIIIDNVAAAVTGTWTTGTSSTDKYANDYRYRSPGTGSNYVKYTPNIITAGNYNVYEWHPAGPNRPTDAQIVVTYSGGSKTVTFNQQVNGGTWNLVGKYQFAKGTNGSVKITDYFLTSGYPQGNVVMADAIKFVFAP